MKNIILFEEFSPSPDVFIDSRDGNEYKTIEVNGTIWMAENLRYDLNTNIMKRHSGFWDMLELKKPEIIKSDNPNYGYYYNFAAAEMSAPKGWEIPSDEDWQDLIDNFSEGKEGTLKYKRAFKNLASPEYSNESFVPEEMGSSGFNALPAGYHGKDVILDYVGEKAMFWTRDKTKMTDYRMYYYFTEGGNINAMGTHESTLMSVRYIKKKQ